MTRPDFVIALVGAVGSLLPETSANLKVELERYGYHPAIIKVSASFSHVVSELTTHVNDTLAREPSYPTTGRYGEIRKGMAIGRAARERYEASHDDAKNGCLAELAIHAMAAIREHAPGPLCFIVDSLKTPSELHVLRRTYGQRLLAVGVHTPQGERKARLVHRIQQTVGRSPDVSECADRLIGIDEKERGTPFGQNVETVFAQCDAFIVASTNDARARGQVERLARLMFLAPFETPTAAETAMMHAFTASLCSASMSRHVGAAVTTPAGDLVATGCNEVPRFRGGPYRSEHACDGRDFTRGQDENAVQKAALVEQLLSIAQMEGVVPEHIDIEEAARKVSRSPKGRDMLARNLTEFGRDVHAEMAALGAAGRRGTPLEGCLLYTTTFPCHNCAKHILDAGIAAVTFIEAYPKSFAEAFHGDSLSVDRAAPDRLLVHAFEGVAPRAYPALFAWRRRRDDNTGRAVGVAPLSSRPWFTLADFLADREVEQRERALLADTQVRLQRVFHLEKAIAALVPEMPRPMVKVGRGTEPASQAPPSSGARQTG
jgi:deoxycytidylate deaminase